ncbi:hypothetical protein EV562_109189 [Streptomyces sp. BK208]|uniref:hypothetical protein n=1 Tax=Streptomyces sp. BK208 TaxID=2512150 RepID=UPI001060C56F|nr:hypothetical protein [Streptomyces sp. BK208]TDT35248.1 hypothetical protein EV562_109189 [Streptomyces sp. BK208]
MTVPGRTASRPSLPGCEDVPERPEPGEEPADRFRRTAPGAARLFARAAFPSDNRAGLAEAGAPTPGARCSRDLPAGRR